MSPICLREAILTVDAKARCCVLRSLALIKYTFRRWTDLQTQLRNFDPGPHGYETAVEGKNGFVCMVERAWMSPFDSPEFWNPYISPEMPKGGHFASPEQPDLLLEDIRKFFAKVDQK